MVIGVVEVSAMTPKENNHVPASSGVEDSVRQRRIPVSVLGLNRCPRGEQNRCYGYAVFPSGIVQRGLSIGVMSVEIAPRFHENLQHGNPSINGCVVKSCPSIGVSRVDVGATSDQVAHRFRVASEGGTDRCGHFPRLPLRHGFCSNRWLRLEAGSSS